MPGTLAATRLACVDPHTRLYALPGWGILVVGSEENPIVARTSHQQDICPIGLLADLLRQPVPAPTGMLRLPAAADPRGP